MQEGKFFHLLDVAFLPNIRMLQHDQVSVAQYFHAFRNHIIGTLSLLLLLLLPEKVFPEPIPERKTTHCKIYSFHGAEPHQTGYNWRLYHTSLCYIPAINRTTPLEIVKSNCNSLIKHLSTSNPFIIFHYSNGLPFRWPYPLLLTYKLLDMGVWNLLKLRKILPTCIYTCK